MKLAACVPLSAVTVAIMTAVSVYALTQLSGAPIPMHWTFDGRASDYQPPALALFLLPAVTALVSLIFAVLPTITPRRGDLNRSVGAYVIVWQGVLGLMLLVHLTMTASALGASLDVVRITIIATGALFTLFGNYLPKVRFNDVFGLRTPWTLANERVWDRSNRAVGPWLMAAGVAAMAGGALIHNMTWAVMVLLIPALAVALGGVAYSAMISGDEARDAEAPSQAQARRR
jgi:uncharacterized membrane protein